MPMGAHRRHLQQQWLLRPFTLRATVQTVSRMSETLGLCTSFCKRSKHLVSVVCVTQVAIVSAVAGVCARQRRGALAILVFSHALH